MRKTLLFIEFMIGATLAFLLQGLFNGILFSNWEADAVYLPFSILAGFAMIVIFQERRRPKC